MAISNVILLTALTASGAQSSPEFNLFESLHPSFENHYVSLAPVPASSHTVKSGENDWTIARKYGISVSALHRANPSVQWRKLQIGQKLNIPGGSTSSSSGGQTYTVVSGDNDYKIASKLGISVSDLHRLNPGVNWRRLQIGQRLNARGSRPAASSGSRSIRNITTSYAVITARTANIRSEPNTNSRVRTKVTAGTEAAVLGREGDWYRLKFPKGTIGYVRGDLLGEASPPAPKTSSPELKPVDVGTASGLLQTSKQFLGVRYTWGGNTDRSGFDCSGFVKKVFADHKISLPRTSRAMSTQGVRVAKHDLQAGDLVFFKTARSRVINHVGIYMGDGNFIHSSSSARRVLIQPFSDYEKKFAGARRMPALMSAGVAEKVVEDAKVEATTGKKSDDAKESRAVYGADAIGK